MQRNDLISRGDAIQAARHAWAKGLEPVQYIEIVPEIDAEPVSHARWIECDAGDGDVYYTCSTCECAWTLIDGTPEGNGMKYCPRCGARMDETEGE